MKFVLSLLLCNLLHADEIVKQYVFPNSISKILLSQNNELYVGTTKGLHHLQGAHWTVYHKAGGDRALDKITALTQTADGTIWIGKAGYYGQGIERLSPSNKWFTERLSTANTKLPGNYISDLCPDKDSMLITIQPDRGGVGGAVDLSFDERSSANWLPNIAATSCACTDQICFIGTQSQGIYQFTRQGRQISHLNVTGAVKALVLDRLNRLWIGSDAGLSYYNTISRIPSALLPLPQKAPITALVADEHNLWVGTSQALLQMGLMDSRITIKNEIQNTSDLFFHQTTGSIWIAAGKSLWSSAHIARALSAQDITALTTIASRQGLDRLDFDPQTNAWSVFNGGWVTKVTNFFFGKNRLDMIEPLDSLAASIQQGYWESVSKDPQLFHLIRRAYVSLSSLYSYYKIDPLKDAAKQQEFIQRFGMVLAKFKTILTEIENRLPVKALYKPMPWFGDTGADIRDNDRVLGMHYVSMSVRGLEDLNAELKEVGNTHTKIDRALEFYPTGAASLFTWPWTQTVNKKMVVFNIHGTYAAGSQEYRSDENLLFRQTKYMAQLMANDQNAPVELYSFGWSGVNDNAARIVAGEELANLVRTYFPPNEYADCYIGHSHGGNVILHFAKTIREYRTPYLIVTLATPIRKDFITDNVNYLFQFYTDNDWVQHYGSYELTNRNRLGTGTHTQSARMYFREDLQKLGLFEHNDRFNSVNIYVTKVETTNDYLSGPIQSHSNLKYLIGSLPKIINDLLRYPANNFYVLKIELEKAAHPSVSEIERLKFQINAAKVPS
ncbi:MAG: hypothetical protein V4534_00155 [Myxococcota bacterium]